MLAHFIPKRQQVVIPRQPEGARNSALSPETAAALFG
jgi:hypothetical protein